MRKRDLIKSIIVAALFALCLPAVAAAQGTYDPWGRPDYRRDRDYRRDGDSNYEDYDRYDRYDRRYLRDAIRRLDRLSSQFQHDLDRAADRSGEEDTRHEHHMNADAREFHRAVRDLKDSFDDGRDLGRSQGAAQVVLDTGAHLERVARHHFYDDRLDSEWSEIRQNLRVIADAYGYSTADYDDGYYRDNDIYRRDPWWRRSSLPR